MCKTFGTEGQIGVQIAFVSASSYQDCSFSQLLEFDATESGSSSRHRRRRLYMM